MPEREERLFGRALYPGFHKGQWYERRTKRQVTAETVFAIMWRLENRSSDLLSAILAEPGRDRYLFAGGYSRRDAKVAAEIIQWLGTPVGLSFLTRCDDVIERLREQGRLYGERTSLREQKRQRALERTAAERGIKL